MRAPMTHTADNTASHPASPRQGRHWTALESLAFVAASSALLWVVIFQLARIA